MSHSFIQSFDPIDDIVALVLQSVASIRNRTTKSVNAISKLADAVVEGVQGHVAHRCVDHPGERTRERTRENGVNCF